MVGAGKRRVVVVLRIHIRRIAVNQCVWPVIGTDQWRKVPMLDLDLAQALLHLREVVDAAIEHDLAGLIRLLITAITLTDDVVIPRGALYIRKPSSVKLTPEIKKALSGVRQAGKLSLQLGAMVLNAPIEVDKVAVDVVIYLKLTGLLWFAKQYPRGTAKYLDIPANLVLREPRYDLLAQGPFTPDPSQKTVNSNLSYLWYCKGASSDKLRMSGDIQPPDIAS